MLATLKKAGVRKASMLKSNNDSQVMLFPGDKDNVMRRVSRRPSYWPKKEEILQGPAARISNILKMMKENFILLVKTTQDDVLPAVTKKDALTQRRKSARQSLAAVTSLLQGFTDMTGKLDMDLINLILEDFERCLNALKYFERKASGELTIKKTLNALKMKRRLAKIDSPYVSGYLNEILELGSQADIVKNRGRRDTVTRPRERQRASDMQVKDITEMLDHYGMAVPHSAEINQELDIINTWEVDIFKIHQVTSGMPLTCVTYRILQDRELFQAFNIPPRIAVNFLSKMEAKYRKVPYHSSMHAADVVQASHIILNAAHVNATELETLSMLLACTIHDVDHPGFTNQYMINTENPLAELYSGSSVLENNSVHVWLRILTERDCDILINMSMPDRKRIKSMVKDLVMATDMANHVSVITDMKSLSDKKHKLEKFSETTNYEQHYALRIPLFCGIIHCCDLANPTKPLPLYMLWVERIKNEFFNQGDQETVRNLKISPMCDRHTVDFNKCQVGFIDYVVLPIWSAVATYCSPDLSKMMLLMSSNRAYYAGINAQNMVDKEKRISQEKTVYKTKDEPDTIRDHESSTHAPNPDQMSLMNLEFEEKVTQSIISILRSSSTATTQYAEENKLAASVSFVFPEAEVISLYCSQDVVDEPPKPKEIPFKRSAKPKSKNPSPAIGSTNAQEEVKQHKSDTSVVSGSSRLSQDEAQRKGTRFARMSAWNSRNSLERDRIVTQEEACQVQKQQKTVARASGIWNHPPTKVDMVPKMSEVSQTGHTSKQKKTRKPKYL